MSPFEVPEGPFTIEKIMESIRTQVVEPSKAALASAAGAAEPGAAAENVEATRPIISDGGPVSRLLAQLELLRQRQSLDPGYRIKSHRAFAGPLFDFFKRVIHWGSRPYTDAVRLRQEAFNEAVLHALREISLQFENNVRQFDDHKAYITSFHKAIHDLQHADGAISERLNAFVEGIVKLAADLREQAGRLHAVQEVTAGFNGRLQTLYDRYDLHPLAELAPAERRLEALDHTRGEYEDIRCRQYHYMALFENAPGQVLDIGCGRGELINMMRIHGIECWGVDTDPLMVEVCRAQGLYAVNQDGLSALREAAPATLGGIFAAQVIEHLFPGDVVRFVALARQKMARGARLVIETLNPGALGVHAKSYWRDLEHKQMIHPEYLKGMLELAGFEEVEVQYLSPFGDADRLPALPPAEELGLAESARAALQERLDRLNDLLYGMQDYVIAARQGEPAQPKEAPAP